jgi:hypothetical protein
MEMLELTSGCRVGALCNSRTVAPRNVPHHLPKAPHYLHSLLALVVISIMFGVHYISHTSGTVSRVPDSSVLQPLAQRQCTS